LFLTWKSALRRCLAESPQSARGASEEFPARHDRWRAGRTIRCERRGCRGRAAAASQGNTASRTLAEKTQSPHPRLHGRRASRPGQPLHPIPRPVHPRSLFRRPGKISSQTSISSTVNLLGGIPSINLRTSSEVKAMGVSLLFAARRTNRMQGEVCKWPKASQRWNLWVNSALALLKQEGKVIVFRRVQVCKGAGTTSYMFNLPQEQQDEVYLSALSLPCERFWQTATRNDRISDLPNRKGTVFS